MNKATYRDYVSPGEQVQSRKSEFTTKLSPEGETAALRGNTQSEQQRKKK